MSSTYSLRHKLGDNVENLSEKREGKVTGLKPFTVNGEETNPHMWINKDKTKVSDHPYYKYW